MSGCILCAQRVTGPGLPSYCADLARDGMPGKLIKPADIANAPAWCPKRGDAA